MKVVVVNYGYDSSSNISAILSRLKINHRVIEHDEIPKCIYTHVILSGGPDHVYEKNSKKIPKWVLDSDVPVLGICYGMQIIVHTFGGLVERMDRPEKKNVRVTEIINGKQITKRRWMNRIDKVTRVPDTFYITGVAENNDIASITDNKRWFGVQYHPESSKSLDVEIFNLFLYHTS